MEEDIRGNKEGNKKKSFRIGNITEKQENIQAGRLISVLKTKVGTRKFLLKWYKQIDWFCVGSLQEAKYVLTPRDAVDVESSLIL